MYSDFIINIVYLNTKGSGVFYVHINGYSNWFLMLLREYDLEIYDVNSCVYLLFF